jgi:dual specificity tyrosine-phosphorylation-regulated kinase 2/3/4
MDLESTISRSTSATSSVNPYYFGVRSPVDSPVPPLPGTTYPSSSPDLRHFTEPITPARDPSAIDRRGLIGVGELATPRWTQAERYMEDDFIEDHEHGQDSSGEGLDLVIPDHENDVPDSPWTIEAVDGESDDREETIERVRNNFISLNHPRLMLRLPLDASCHPASTFNDV